MDRQRRKQFARVAKLVAAEIKQKKLIDGQIDQKLQLDADLHAVSFCALLSYGDPREDEPLANAKRRCFEHFPHLKYVLAQGSTRDIKSWELAAFALPVLLADHPGIDKDQLIRNTWLAAPPWLIWFTFGDVTASILGLGLPDLSEVRMFERSKGILANWPELPEQKFEARLRPPRTANDFTPSDYVFMKEMIHVPEEQMTRLDRKRFYAILERLPEEPETDTIS